MFVLQLKYIMQDERKNEEDSEHCYHNIDSDEGYHCLNCGKDFSEDIMSAAYDRVKDIRKYGH